MEGYLFGGGGIRMIKGSDGAMSRVVHMLSDHLVHQGNFPDALEDLVQRKSILSLRSV